MSPFSFDIEESIRNGRWGSLDSTYSDSCWKASTKPETTERRGEEEEEEGWRLEEQDEDAKKGISCRVLGTCLAADEATARACTRIK